MDKKLDLKGYNLFSTRQTFRLTAVHFASNGRVRCV